MRAHQWYNIVNEEGQPIENAIVNVYLANSTTSATIYHQETGGTPDTVGQLTSNGVGYFEFWVADSSETGGYSFTQKFKITWEKPGVADGFIDYIDVFPLSYPGVDITNADISTQYNKDKLISNYLGYMWETHRNTNITYSGAASGSSPHGITILDEDNMASDSNTSLATQQSIKAYVDSQNYPFQNIDVDIVDSPETIDSFSKTVSNGCIWNYYLYKSTNFRTGQIMATWDDSTNTVQYAESTTPDIGDTTDISFTVIISGDNVILQATALSNNWIIKGKRMIL